MTMPLQTLLDGSLCTMKLLILTCLVAVALARPNQEDSNEHTPVDIRQEHVAVDPTQRACSSSSSSEEDASINTEQKHISTEEMSRQHYLEQLFRVIKNRQLQLQSLLAQEQIHRMNQHNQMQMRQPMKVMHQVPFYLQYPQAFAYPFNPWFYIPQVMQDAPVQAIVDIFKPTTPKNVEKFVMPQW
ncbi:alpha-S1-casein [Dipodomys merriami]|uniref:alpha-S1-casein n=1 Tax=Dipodomys merriami TaxID=94247 RepID=UPI00385605A0